VPRSTAVVVVSDAHLSGDSGDTTAAFHRFLEAVPDLGDHLLINGDLFEFWFTYRFVIPRAVFPTLAALARVRQAGVRLTITGGNHDRWGATFWENELDAEFHSRPIELDLAGWFSWVCHGDGIVELDSTGRFMHRITGHPATARTFRMIHPDLAFWMVRRLSQYLATRRHDEGIVARAAAAQSEYAKKLLRDSGKLDLVVFGHTHRHALESVSENRWYLNPGAWSDGHRYAVISQEGPKLCEFS
jgi:UDP-2,3-diacylglucosamine hydrolase